MKLWNQATLLHVLFITLKPPSLLFINLVWAGPFSLRPFSLVYFEFWQVSF